MPFRSLSPHLRPFGQNTYTKIKVEYPPGSAPCPHIGYAPGAKLGGKRVLLGMHIYKISTKHDGHSRPTERKNMKNAYRGGRTFKTHPPPPTHTHTCFSTSPWEFLQPEIQPYSRVDTDVLMEVSYRCNFLAVSDSSTCPDIGTSWCHAGIIEHFEIRGFKMTP